MTQDLDLSITICSWNTKEDLRYCLQSLENQKGDVSFEVIVWDNASEDNSAEMVEKEFPWVRLIKSPANIGFSAGHNRAASCSKGHFLFVLNSDTYVHPGALKKIIDYMKEHPDTAILGPKLLNPNGTLQYSCRRFPTPMAALFRNTPLGKLFPRNPYLREYLMQDWSHDEIREVDWVSGAAMCVRREAWEKLKGFDEQFFMYMEDVDICFRAWQMGMRVVYFPQAVVTHAIGRSTDRVANKMIRLFHKSMLGFYKKNYLPKVPLWLRPFAVMGASLLLFGRCYTLIAKNIWDEIRRRVKKR